MEIKKAREEAGAGREYYALVRQDKRSHHLKCSTVRYRRSDELMYSGQQRPPRCRQGSIRLQSARDQLLPPHCTCVFISSDPLLKVTTRYPHALIFSDPSTSDLIQPDWN